MASTIQITVLFCSACGKLENTQDIYETTGVSIPTLLWAHHGMAYGFDDLWLCGKCLTRSLGALLEAVQTRQEAEHEDAEEAARQTRAQERHALEGWYYVEGRKARVHYYRDNRSLCHKLYATSLWGAVTGFTEIPRGFTGTLCPGCAAALNGEPALDDSAPDALRKDALRKARDKDAATRRADAYNRGCESTYHGHAPCEERYGPESLGMWCKPCREAVKSPGWAVVQTYGMVTATGVHWVESTGLQCGDTLCGLPVFALLGPAQTSDSPKCPACSAAVAARGSEVRS